MKGYVVIGSTGDYDDFSEWAVAFFTDEIEAGLWADKAEKKAEALHEEWIREKDISKFQSKMGCNPYDPENDNRSSEVAYSVREILFNPKID